MKIDKVIWSASEEYSDFWNINSKLHNKYLGMDRDWETQPQQQTLLRH